MLLATTSLNLIFAGSGWIGLPGVPEECYTDKTGTPGWVMEELTCYYGVAVVGTKQSCVEHPNYPYSCGVILSCGAPCSVAIFCSIFSIKEHF